MNYKNQEKIIAHSIFLLGSIIVLNPFISILFLALSEPGTRVSGFTVPSGIYFDTSRDSSPQRRTKQEEEFEEIK